MLEHRDGNAERREALANAFHRLHKDWLLQFLDGGAEAAAEGSDSAEDAIGFAEDGAVSPIGGAAARRGRR